MSQTAETAVSSVIHQHRYAMLVDYYGPAFSGAQRQQNTDNTVQQALETALDRLYVTHGPVVLAGRTDAGVHAKGQVIHVDLDPQSLRNIHHLTRAMNAVLPDTIAVQDIAANVGESFHARYKANLRWYQYRLYTGPVRSTAMRRDASHRPGPLDVARLNALCAPLLGHHDFSSFQCPRTASPNPVCHVQHALWHSHDDEVVFDLIANRFLYKMVRNIVGTQLQLADGQGRLDGAMEAILAGKNRRLAGPTAQPHGLSLMAVGYPKPWDFFAGNVYVMKLQQIQQEFRGYENVFRKAS